MVRTKESRLATKARNKALLDTIARCEKKWAPELVDFPVPGTSNILMKLAYAESLDRVQTTKDSSGNIAPDFAGIPNIYIFGSTRDQFRQTRDYMAADSEQRFNERYIHWSPEPNELLGAIYRDAADVILVCEPDHYRPRDLVSRLPVSEAEKKEILLRERLVRKGVASESRGNYDFTIEPNQRRRNVLVTRRDLSKIARQYDLAIRDRVTRGYVELLDYVIAHPAQVKGVTVADVLTMTDQSDAATCVKEYILDHLGALPAGRSGFSAEQTTRQRKSGVFARGVSFAKKSGKFRHLYDS
jgi:hypothetical protein